MKLVKKERNHILDRIRGFAVLLMIIAHVGVFINYNESPIFAGTSKLADMIAFTCFLIVSGAVAYLVYINNGKRLEKRGLGDRILKLLLAYYLVSLVAILPELNKDFSRKLLEVLLFVRVPSYSEFIIPFVIYGLSLAPLKQFYKKIAGDLKLLMIVGGIAYILGWLLYQAPIPKGPAAYTSFLSGYSDWYRFPILQYFPVFLFGMYWGDLIHRKKLHLVSYIKHGLIINLIFLVFTVAGIILQTPTSDLFQRWPPTPLFLLLGIIAFILLYLFFFYFESRIKITGPLIYLGQNAFGYYFLHIVLLYFYRHYVNVQVPSVLLVIVYLSIVLGISAFLVELYKIFKGKI